MTNTKMILVYLESSDSSTIRGKPIRCLSHHCSLLPNTGMMNEVRLLVTILLITEYKNDIRLIVMYTANLLVKILL